jgi:hypothetical protein
VHQYNQEVARYGSVPNATSAANNNNTSGGSGGGGGGGGGGGVGDALIDDALREERKIIIYPGTTIVIISAAVAIQATWRSYACRRALRPSLASRVVRRRAAVCLVRWWRATLLRKRVAMLAGIRAYGCSIDSTELYVRGDVFDAVVSKASAAYASVYDVICLSIVSTGCTCVVTYSTPW